jgi:peptide-methionine (S)-S-oxide reductase
VRTRVGYAGGSLANPTYYNLGDHTESIQIDFDPEVITYEELLEIFWNRHDPTLVSTSVQYQSMILTSGDVQQQIALQSRDQKEVELGKSIQTIITPLEAFTRAEAYHQKYYLRGKADLVAILQQVYPDEADWVDSTAAARMNGLAGGHLSWDDLLP